jgi:polyketide cyclase/dehydrase/lipid transport protein
MKSFSLEKFITTPVEQVFSIFSDIDHAADNISGVIKIEKLTEGPVGVGTRFKQTRHLLNMDATETLEFIEFTAFKSYTVKAEFCGEEYTVWINFERRSAGTTVFIKCQVRPLSLIGKFASPLGSVLMTSIRKVFEQDLNDLKAVCEAQNNHG